MLEKKHKILVAAADGAHARFFDYSHDRDGAAARQVKVMDHPAAASRDLVADGPGHGQDSMGGGRHAIEPRTDPHELEETQFLSGVIKEITKESKAYDQLILIAPPRALAILRGHMARDVKDRVVLELNKDVLKMPAEAVAKLVEDSLAVSVLH